MMQLSETAAAIGDSGIRAMFERAAGYSKVINLCIGEPGYPTPPNVIAAGKEGLDLGYTKYTSNAGILPLRKELARKLARENGIAADPETQIIVTAGGVEAVLLAMLVTVDAGAEVLVPTPCWPNYEKQIQIAGGRMVPVPCREEDRFVPRAKVIESQVTPRTRVLVLNSPNNPTGAVIPPGELENIRQVVLRHNLTVISDEPYERLRYGGAPQVSIASLPDMAERTLTVNTFSKTYAMSGWRVGYACGPREAIAAMVKIKEQTSSSVNASAQYACIEALRGTEDAVREMVRGYANRREILVDGLNACRGVSCLKPDGAFYAFANVKRFGVTAEELAIRILDEVQVVTTPGTAFGCYGEGYLRMSFASSPEELMEAVDRLQKFFERFARK